MKHPSVTLAHQLPLRVRISVPALAEHRAACERVAEGLALSPACDRVRVRLSTGSVIVESRECTLDARALTDEVASLVAAELDENGRPLKDREPPHPHYHPTRMARALAHAVSELNMSVRKALDDRADLGTLMPVFFAMGGVTEVATTNTLPTPPWFNLLWWSIRSFMTFNPDALQEEMRAHVNVDDASKVNDSS